VQPSVSATLNLQKRAGRTPIFPCIFSDILVSFPWQPEKPEP
jgi:hypothetical protein